MHSQFWLCLAWPCPLHPAESAWHVRTPGGSVGLPPAQGPCLAPVWANLVSEWNHGPWRILVALVGLPPEPGFAQERASGHQALGCTGADITGRPHLLNLAAISLVIQEEQFLGHQPAAA